MSTTSIVEFTEPTHVLDVPGFGRIVLEALPVREEEILGSVILRFAGLEVQLLRFSQVMVNPDPKKKDYLPEFYCAYGDDKHPFLALVGLLEVVLVGRNGTICAKYRLNRELDDDWGFYNYRLVPGKEGFVFVYEAGVVSFSTDGKVTWEKPISPHDYLLSFDDNVLHFRSDEFSDYGEGDWHMRRDTGEVCKEQNT